MPHSFFGELTKKIHVNYLVLCLINSKHFKCTHTHTLSLKFKEEVSSMKKLDSLRFKMNRMWNKGGYD